ncbi:U32 family peptidase, partial [Methanosarcinaceae archaeon]|nr:U32 family peptidase [Methanosarcinaceae archaeon]
MSSGTGNGSALDADADFGGADAAADIAGAADVGGISGGAAFPERTSRPEILAPAGTIYSMIAGLRCGADAVYAGASRFGARAYAGNFSDDELAFGIDMAHTLGSCVHVTMNTLYRDDELKDALRLLDRLYREGADAIIVQDVGFLSLVRRKYPEMP